MKRYFLIACAVIVAFLIAVIGLLPVLVDADRFRPQVEQQASAALGRAVTIGRLKLAVFSGGVSADRISVADDPAFSQQPFLQAQSLDVGVELLPLIFSKALHVTSLTLQAPEIHLVRNAHAKWNYASIGTQTHAKEKTPPADTGSASDISVGSLHVKNGKIIVSNGRSSHTYEDVEVTAKNLSFASVMPFQVSAKTPGSGTLDVDGKLGPVNREDASATPVLATVKVAHMDIGATGFLDPSSGIGGVVDYDGTLHSDGKTARLEGKAHAEKLKLVKSGAPARQPITFDYSSDYKVEQKTGTLTKGAINMGKTQATLSGGYDTHGDATLVHMKLNGANMPISEVEGLLPAFGITLPPGASLQGGVTSMNLSLDGPLDHLVITGPLSVSNTKLAGFDLGSKLKGLGALAGVSGGGSETMIQTLSSNLRVAPEGIRADNLNLVLPQYGTLTGSGTIGAGNSLDFKMLAKLKNGGGLVGGLSQIASFGQAKGELPFFLRGTTNNPEIVPDMGHAVGSTVAAPAKGIGGVFGGLFGSKK